MNEVRVRFAPSPTGYLHIGSARTAYFNWLFARKEKGRLILRIEDTDISRHQEDMIATILDSLKWLSVRWDEGPDIGGDYGPYRQSERNEYYRKYADFLLGSKKAYRCFCTPEELEQRRQDYAKKGEFFSYDRKCLELDDRQIKDRLKQKMPFSIRMLVPDGKEISFKDTVYGKIKVNSSNIDDFIILRSNNLPTYNFSAVIDDYLMKITHIIRGEDHLSNTPKQLLIYDSLNISPPSFTHLPMILSKDGEKLSKRHGAISVESYRDEGFLQEAVKNYLALLGWAFDEKTTIFSEKEIIKKFSLETINKKASRFDYEKLLHINSMYIKNHEISDLAGMLKDRLKKRITEMDKSDLKNNCLKEADLKNPEAVGAIFREIEDKILYIIPLVNKRAKTLNEIEKMILPFFFEIIYPDEIKNFFAGKNINAASLLEQAKSTLSKITDNDFCLPLIEKELRDLAEANNITFGELAEVLRLALWGRTVSLPLFETIIILGRKKSLHRLSEYLELIS
ncbi:MAG TPA: glutamate--tRNA ligase [Actinobacteria bacterium]|nr:glutamate--tRNA ligase [Actinomycetota bacterium]